MTNINNLYPHLQLYKEYINNGDVFNATNLLSHNDELNKYILDKVDEYNYMTSNDVSNYIDEKISNGELLSSNQPMLSEHSDSYLGVGGYEIWENAEEENPDLNNIVSQGTLYDAIRNYQPTMWNTDLNLAQILIDGLPLSHINPIFDKNGIILDFIPEYVKINDFVITQDKALLLITNIKNLFGLLIAEYSIISSPYVIRSSNGSIYQITVSNSGELNTVLYEHKSV